MLKNTGQSLTKEQFDRVKKEQRNTQNMWLSSWAFPCDDPQERNSLSRAPKFVCKGMYGCDVGDCCSLFQSSDILELRRMTQFRLDKMKEGKEQDQGKITLLQSDVHKLWNGTRFNKVPVELGEYDKVEVCVCAYALLIGMKPTSAQTALQRVRNNVPLASHVPTEGTTKQDLVERKSLHYTFLKKYVTNVLMSAHECNPAPGAAKDKQTVLTKRSWKDKWEDCCKYFKEQNPGEEIGSMNMLKEVWRKEDRLKEKKAMSHSKCDICNNLDKQLAVLFGKSGAAAAQRRRFIRRAKAEHEGKHLSMRSVLDDHGFMAFVNPSQVWCICCDAMTERTTELPRWNNQYFRLPKSVAGTLPKWKFKLTATYCYGYGFVPFLSHESIRHGANLVWTVVWLSICKLRSIMAHTRTFCSLFLTTPPARTRRRSCLRWVPGWWRRSDSSRYGSTS